MVCPLYRECPLLRESNCIILIGGLKFGDLVLSIVERALIQCPLFGVSIKRESTVHVYGLIDISFFSLFLFGISFALFYTIYGVFCV